jgi:predicted component of type VI protein secretion system
MRTLRLHIQDGARSATLRFSRFPILVGRDPNAECRLEFPTVSRHHARIDLRNGRLTLCDQGSLVGTWVHNRSCRLPACAIVDFESVGNEFSIGELHLRAELRDVGPVEKEAVGGIGEAADGLQRILERLSPEDIEADPRCKGKWGPFRYKAYWTELKRRAARMREYEVTPAETDRGSPLRSARRPWCCA